MAHLYVENVNPKDRFDLLELQMDNGSTAVIRRGSTYTLTANELSRARRFVVMISSAQVPVAPEVIARLPIVGDPDEGDVPVWRAAYGAFAAEPVSGIGGGAGLPAGGPGVLSRDVAEGTASWVDVVEINASNLPSAPFGSIAATNVQDALEEIATEAGAGGGAPTGSAGGVLSGTYPNPSFAVDMATQTELDAHVNDASDAHDASAISFSPTGSIAATDTQAAISEVASEASSALSSHAAQTTGAHGISNTAALVGFVKFNGTSWPARPDFPVVLWLLGSGSANDPSANMQVGDLWFPETA